MKISLLKILFRAASSIVGVAVVVSAGFACAQASSSESASSFGIVPPGSYQSDQIDNVNMDTGNDIIQIPLFSLPQRGKLTLGFSAVANSTDWQEDEICTPDGSTCMYEYSAYSPAYAQAPATFSLVQIGPVIVPDHIPGYLRSSQTNLYCYSLGGADPESECLSYDYIGWNITDSLGGSHALFYNQSNLSQLRSTDGTGYLLYTNVSDPYNYAEIGNGETSWTILDPNGISTSTVVNSSGQSTTTQSDPDNNTITYLPSVTPGGPAQYVDSVGRTIPDVPSPGSATSSTAGCPDLGLQYQPVVGSVAWNVPGPNNTSATYLVCYTQVYYHTDFFDYGGQDQVLYSYANGNNYTYYYDEAIGATWAIQSIVLPDGKSYWGFAYDAANPADSSSIAYGMLTKLMFPQGGSISYTYVETSGPCFTTPTDTSTFALSSRTVTDIYGHSYRWNYSIDNQETPGANTVTDPSGNDTMYTFQKQIWAGTCADLEASRTIYQGSSTSGSGTVLKSMQTTFNEVAPPEPIYSTPFGYGNALRQSVATTLTGAGTSTSSTGYDQSFTASAPSCEIEETSSCTIANTGGVTLAIGMPISTSLTDYSGAALRSTQTSYLWQTNSEYFGANLLNTPSSVTVSNGSGPLSQSTYAYDETGYVAAGHIAGHRTTQAVSNLQSHTAWTSMGAVDHTIDSNGNTTQYSYDSTGLFPSSIQQPTAANGVAHVDHYTWDANTGNMLSHTDQNGNLTDYSYNDPFGRLTLIDSAVGALNINGASAESKTAYSYPSATEVDVAQDQTTTGDGVLKSSTFYDGLGRAIKTSGADGSVIETAYDGLGRTCAVSNPTFSDPGPLSCAAGSNPAPTSPTDGITYSAYDALGRKTLQTQPDGNTQSWSYNGNVVDFYDEDHSHWQQTSDALGRLTKVLENDPGGSGALTLETDYAYDALDDLTSVNQKGGSGDTPRTRTFVYDGLSRLISAINPESGTVTYSYTTAGGGLCSGDPTNVCSRTDARGVVTSYSYDALNRIATKSYANDPANTPTLTYGYDTANSLQSSNEDNPIGHLSFIEAEVGETPLVARLNVDYDQKGISLASINCIGADAPTCNSNFTNTSGNITLYEYDLDEEPILSGDESWVGTFGSNTAPSGIYALTYDTGGRLTSIVSTEYRTDSTSAPNITTTAFNSPVYNAFGQLTSANLGLDPTSGVPAITLSRSYDKRGRVTGEIDANPQMQPVYDYSVSYDGNNNVTGFTDGVLGTWSIVNDSLHRLSQGTGTAGLGAGLSFQETYDHFGNRNQETLTEGSAQESTTYLNFTQGNNRVDGWSYDAAGNLLYDGVNHYLYDGEGRLCAVEQSASGSGIIGYFYGPDGTRLEKGSLTSFSCDMTQNGFSLTNLYTVGPSGEEVQEIDGSSNLIHDNVFLEGRLLGTFSGTTYSASDWEYALNDWVGTKRVIANYDGSVSTSFSSSPFGDSLTNLGPGSDPSEQHFTGKDRDQESNLDYFGARYYASTMGRFMSPDPAGLYYADPSNPQSLNLYSYGWNNPLHNIDPSGMECVWDDGSYDASDDPDTGNAQGCSSQGGTYVDPSLFENALMTNGQNANIQYGSWSGQANSTIASSWLGASASVNGNTPWTFTDFQAMYQAWNTGILPQQLNYGPWSVESIDMSHNWAVNQATAAYIKAGCPALYGFNASHMGAAVDSWGNVVLGQPDWLELQVGGFSGTITGSGGDAQFTVNNSMSNSSFNGQSAATGGHSTDNPNGPNGPRHNVQQTFKWSEQGLCQ